MVPSGDYEILIGASSIDIKLSNLVEINSSDKMLDEDNISEWYKNPVGYPSKEDFEKLYGRKVNPYNPPKKGEYDLNCSLNEIKDSRAGKMMIESMRLEMLKNFGGGETNQEFIFIQAITISTPMQRLAQQSGDKTLLETFKKIVFEGNNG